MLNLERVFKSNRHIKSLTGVSVEEFKILSQTFEEILYAHLSSKKRIRKVGGGRKGALKEAQSKLFYILFYLKVYPTYDLASFIFGVNRSQCFHWTVLFMPLLEKALGYHLVLPKRKIRSMEEFITLCPDVKDLFIDGTERRTQRPQKAKTQKKRYSGKKKGYTRKNGIIADEQKKILFVSPTKEGRTHDLTQMKKSGVLAYIPSDKTLWVDKGYQSIQSALKNNNPVMIPHKKPKGKQLTLQQKQENRIIAGIRIVVEHAINGIKRFGSMAGVYRNRRGQDDSMIHLCAGLWNFHLQYAHC